jgi:hypothetical protein
VANDQGNPEARDWRASYREVRGAIYDQYVIDREVGRRVQLEKDGPLVDSFDLTHDDLSAAADRRARQVVEEAIRREEDPKAVLERRRRRALHEESARP